jgi:tetratricopeptide (TPR) repeat protein
VDFTKHLQKAEEAVRRKNFDFAVELYRQLLDLDPDQEDARRGLRKATFERFQAKKGGAFLRAIGGAMPLGKAKALVKVGRHDAAAKALEDYLAKSPDDEEANLLLGECLEQAGHLKSARAVYEFVAQIAPKNPEGLKRAGAMAQAAGDTAAALGYFERALAIDPRDQDALKARKNLAAETALSASRLDQVSHSREAVVDQEETARLERARRRHLSPEELTAERDRLEARYTEDPRNVELMLQLAEVHDKLGDSEAALDVAERALDYKRDDYDLVCKVGSLRGKTIKRRMARAEKDGDRVRADELEQELARHEVVDHRRRVALRPTDGSLALEFAARLVKSGDVDEALGVLQKLPNEPRHAATLALLKGRCFQAKGFADLAAKELRAALVGSAPTDDRAKEIRYHLGLLAESQGDVAAAKEHFGQVFEVDIAYRDVAKRMEALRGR